MWRYPGPSTARRAPLRPDLASYHSRTQIFLFSLKSDLDLLAGRLVHHHGDGSGTSVSRAATAGGLAFRDRGSRRAEAQRAAAAPGARRRAPPRCTSYSARGRRCPISDHARKPATNEPTARLFLLSNCQLRGGFSQKKLHVDGSTLLRCTCRGPCLDLYLKIF